MTGQPPTQADSATEIQAKRLASVATLARPVQHDINNLLTVVFANLLPSAVYHAAIPTANASLPSTHGVDGTVCLGPSCFGPTHIIIAALCGAGE